jgi:hypothetical protein
MSTAGKGLQTETLLNENDVIDAVERAFAERGFATRGKCTTSDCGVDLYVADLLGQEWRIEAKGETSADAGSKRYGKQFNGSQVSVHVAKAIHQAMALRAQHKSSGIGIALPEGLHHRKEVGAVGDALAVLDIFVIWVSQDGSVQLPPLP